MIAAIYGRKSTEQTGADADAKSVARQLENARTFALTKGWRVEDAHVYSDDAISGAETKKLVNRQRLLDALDHGRPAFQVLVMRDASRFSRRDGDEAFGELKRIAQAGVEIWFYQDGTRFSFGTFGDNVVGFVRAEMNAEYRRQIAKWTREAMLRKANSGHATGGRTFGYDLVDVIGDRRVRRAPGTRRHPEASHVERAVNSDEAVVVRRIFALCASGSGYVRIAKQLNAEGALVPRPQQLRPAAWSRSSVYEVLHRPLYRGVLEWNKTKKRDAEGKTAVSARPESDWLRLDLPDLRIVDDEAWEAAHRRLDAARAEYERVTRGQRRFRRDQDSKYLLTGFGKCGACGGGMHVRSRSHGKRRVFFYACTSHFNRGPEVCSHLDQWPMEEIDREVLATIAGDVLAPDLAEDVIATARQIFNTTDRSDHRDQLRRELAAIELEQSRLTEAIASGGSIPVLMERLRASETKRREVRTQVERASKGSQAPSWREIERRIRQSLTDWRSLLTGDVAQVRQGFRQLLTGPIRLTPFVERGFRAIRFEGQIGLAAVFGGEVLGSTAVVTSVASPAGSGVDYQPVFQGIWRSDRRAA